MNSSGGGTEEEVKKEATEETEAVDPPADKPKEEEQSALSKDDDDDEDDGGGGDEKEAMDPPESPNPMAQATAYPQLYAPHLTPQQGGGYYMYSNQVQITPEPPSPGPNGMYDAASFRQQQFNPFGGQYAGGIPPPPLSPRVSSMGSLPPPSPLFPRVASNSAGRMSPGGNGGAPPSPASYLHSPGLGAAAVAMYQYGAYGNGAGSDVSAEENNAWSNRSSQHLYQQSPQLYGITRSSSAGSRTYSFDEMLPPAMLDVQDAQGNQAYSPYGQSQTAGVSGTLFAQQTWGYGSSGEMHNAPPSPAPPRPVLPHMPAGYGVAPRVPPGPPPYGAQYYPATSPGPPIQTTASNKGPDGANLFIFHIPNHFTNLDMYHLFCPYGNLLSVRIMVERETGRSRGFGFVSYDNPESAAMAIKELNGFAIGNKRLKVQHKQIRAGEREQLHQDHSPGYLSSPSGDYGVGSPYSAGAEYSAAAGVDATSPHSTSSWYDETKAAPQSMPPVDEENRDGGYKGKSPDEEGADLHRSGLGNLDPLRNALPDISGQGAVK